MILYQKLYRDQSPFYYIFKVLKCYEWSSIGKQVNDNSLVVWYDPDGGYVVVKAGNRGGIPGSARVSTSG